MQSYNNIQHVLSSCSGDVLPECRVNIGLKWGADIRSQLSEESERANSLAASRQEGLEKTLADSMREFDEQQSSASRKNDPGQEACQEQWWTRDVRLAKLLA